MQTSLLYACSCVQVAQFNNQKGSNAAKTPSHGCNLIKVRSRVIWRANATIHIRRGSARCSINGIPVVLRVHWHIPPSFLPALVLFFFFPRSFQVDLKNHPFLFSRSHSITCCYKLQSLYLFLQNMKISLKLPIHRRNRDTFIFLIYTEQENL